jgi:hypothetical protein
MTATITIVAHKPGGSVTITSAPANVLPGQGAGVSAAVTDSNGNAVANPNVVWSTSNPVQATVARIIFKGHVYPPNFYAYLGGAVTLTASYNGQAASAPMTVYLGSTKGQTTCPLTSATVVYSHATPATNGLQFAQVYQLNGDGTGVVNLTQQPGWFYSEPTVNLPDQRILLQQQYAPGGPSEGPEAIAIAEPIATSPRTVWIDSNSALGWGDALYPFIYPTGPSGLNHGLVAFASHLTRALKADPNVTNAFSVHTSGATLIALTNLPDGKNCTEVSIAPLGDQMAMACDTSGSSQIYLTDQNGNITRRLTDFMVCCSGGYLGASYPRWSPDETMLTFTGTSPTPPYLTSIYRINSDGTGLKQLTSNSSYPDQASWSMDGGTIAFAQWTSTSSDSRIFLMNYDGTNVRQLTGPTSQAHVEDWYPAFGCK